MNTKRTWRTLAATIISLTLGISPLLAEEPIDNSEYPYCCKKNWSSGGRGRYRNYDFDKTETLDGEVVSVNANISRNETFLGTHLMINTDKETIEVHVAPSWYLAEQEFEISPQDKITVEGSRINVNGKEVIIAREIKKGDRTLALRDAGGIPLWRRQEGSRRR